MMRAKFPTLLLSAAFALPAAAAPPSVDDIRQALAAGKTEKAAQLAEEALPTAPDAEAILLRYLRFKAYVLDLAPGNEELFRRVTKDVRRKEKQTFYDDLVDRLEREVREAGADALPVVVDALAGGDALDRLLALGLLDGLAEDEAGLPWSVPTGAAATSPAEAARTATLAALEGCATAEELLGAVPAYAIEDQRDREPYLQTVLTALNGLEFLAAADLPSWGNAAAFALDCRGTAGTILDDRARQREHSAELRGPLLERARSSTHLAARLDAIEMLGRVGDCADRMALAALTGGEVGEAAELASERIRKRNSCPGS